MVPTQPSEGGSSIGIRASSWRDLCSSVMGKVLTSPCPAPGISSHEGCSSAAAVDQGSRSHVQGMETTGAVQDHGQDVETFREPGRKRPSGAVPQGGTSASAGLVLLLRSLFVPHTSSPLLKTSPASPCSH